VSAPAPVSIHSGEVGFRDAMAHVAAAVTVATVVDKHGRPRGVTISSFSSLSLDPPLVLFCLAGTSSSHPAFAAAGRFAVSVLAAGQTDLARRLAGPPEGRRAVRWEWLDGLPVVPDCLVQLVCTEHERVRGGDHTIMIGRVRRAVSIGGDPLLYHRRRFHHLGVHDHDA
jgi:flavin reductase ActVB